MSCGPVRTLALGPGTDDLPCKQHILVQRSASAHQYILRAAHSLATGTFWNVPIACWCCHWLWTRKSFPALISSASSPCLGAMMTRRPPSLPSPARLPFSNIHAPLALKGLKPRHLAAPCLLKVCLWLPSHTGIPPISKEGVHGTPSLPAHVTPIHL